MAWIKPEYLSGFWNVFIGDNTEGLKTVMWSVSVVLSEEVLGCGNGSGIESGGRFIKN